VASIGHNWRIIDDVLCPVSESAHEGFALVLRMREILSWFPRCHFIIENPRGMLRKMAIMSDLCRSTVTFCKYGETRMKPTDLWMSFLFTFKPPCKNGDPCHERAPRGARTGTQGLKGAYLRAMLPRAFCADVVAQVTDLLDVERRIHDGKTQK
jgi:hypothetical protein